MPVRVVVDTNVVVSGLHSSSGNEAGVLTLMNSGLIRVCVSPELLAEYDAVLHRQKFRHIPAESIRGTLEMLRQGHTVQPSMKITASPDPADNRFLECAEAAKADYLITGNKRHFPSTWKNTRIVTAREFLNALRTS